MTASHVTVPPSFTGAFRWYCQLCQLFYSGGHMHYCPARNGEVVDIRDQAQPDQVQPAAPAPVPFLPTDSAERKGMPLCTGLLDYFPAALAAVAKLSRAGSEKHNPGQPMQWSRAKSADHADCVVRHLVDRGVINPETGMSHTVEVAWRALALLQEELEAAGAPRSRAST